MEPKKFADESLQSRFWPKVNRISGGCWLWEASRSSVGYGQISVGSKPRTVHRLVYELYYGAIRDGLFVLHRCDVRHCCNPDHLFLGTAADNTADMVNKGRNVFLSGEQSSNSKLTHQQVMEIHRRWREGGVTQTQLGKEFNVHSSWISRIVRGEFWKHIDAEAALSSLPL